MTSKHRDKAKRLFSQGVGKSEIAKRCGITRQTVDRWSKEPDFTEIDGLEELIEEADTEILGASQQILSIDLRIDDLLAYREGQKRHALAAEDMALKLNLLCDSLLTHLVQNPGEITPRMLPQLIKMYIDLSKNFSDCWARATGIEGRIRDEINTEIDDKNKAINLLVSNANLKEFQNLVVKHFPVNQDEIKAIAEETQTTLNSDNAEELVKEYFRFVDSLAIEEE